MKRIRVPWRIKNYISNTYPTAYYLAYNLFNKSNHNNNWDKQLIETWDDIGRTWPNRCEKIQKITNKQDRILDVGCGTGSILRTLKQHGYENLYGLEHSLVAVEKLSELGINMKYGQLPTISFEDNHFDIVIASEVLEHILFHHRFIKEIVRVLRPGGSGFIYVPNNCLGPIDEPSHVRTYTAKSLYKLLDDKCEVITISETKEKHMEVSFLFANITKYTK